jgi:hypothetical protein
MHSTDWSRVVLSGISLPVSTLLQNLILDPTLSFSPYFYPILVGGFVTFLISLGEFITKKHVWSEGVWNVAGIGLAGFVIVSWARYQSIFVSLMAELAIIGAIVIVLLLTRTATTKRYGKRGTRIVFFGVILATLFPMATIIQNVGEPPVVMVSPLPNPYVEFTSYNYPREVQNQTLNVSISCAFANAWEFRLTAETNQSLLSAYLDDIKNGPVEIQFLERGRVYSSVLRIVASPDIPDGTYSVTLHFSYKDGIGQSYTKSADPITVNTRSVMPTPGPPGGEGLTLQFSPIWMVVLVELIIYAVIVYDSERKRVGTERDKVLSEKREETLPPPPPPPPP